MPQDQRSKAARFILAERNLRLLPSERLQGFQCGCARAKFCDSLQGLQTHCGRAHVGTSQDDLVLYASVKNINTGVEFKVLINWIGERIHPSNSEAQVEELEDDPELRVEGASGDSEEEIDASSYAEAIGQDQGQRMGLREVVEEGWKGIMHAPTRDRCLENWGKLLGRLRALKRTGEAKILYQPKFVTDDNDELRRREEELERREESGPRNRRARKATPSEVLFLESTKDLSSEKKNTILHMLRHPEFELDDITFNTGEAAIRWSLSEFKNSLDIEVKSHTFEDGTYHKLIRSVSQSVVTY